MEAAPPDPDRSERDGVRFGYHHKGSVMAQRHGSGWMEGAGGGVATGGLRRRFQDQKSEATTTGAEFDMF